MRAPSASRRWTGEGELENELLARDETIARLEEARTGLQVANLALKGDLEKAARDQAGGQTRLGRLKAERDEAEKKLADRDREIGELRQTLARLETRLKEATAATRKEQEALAAAEARLAADKDRLQGVVTEKDRHLEMLQTQLLDRDRQLREVQEKNRESLEAGRKSAAERDTALGDLTRTRRENESLKGRNAQLLADLSHYQEQLKALGGETGEAEERTRRVKAAYEKLLAELRSEIESKEAVIQQTRERMTVTMVDRVLFESGRAVITPGGRQRLKKLADGLSDVSDGRIQVAGHTDDVPIAPEYRYKYPSNWELSAARAASVARFLIAEGGVPPEHIEIAGHSYFKPVAGNETDEGRARNRRVEIAIVP